jgi:hypothetical protein
MVGGVAGTYGCSAGFAGGDCAGLYGGDWVGANFGGEDGLGKGSATGGGFVVIESVRWVPSNSSSHSLIEVTGGAGDGDRAGGMSFGSDGLVELRY